MGFVSSVLVIILSVSLGLTSLRCDGQTVDVRLVLAGIVSCTNTSISNAGTYALVPKATVDFTCGIWLLQRVFKSTTTNNAGVYTMSFSAADILLTNPEFCSLRVTFPPSSCIFDPPGGVLRFPIIGIRSSSGLLTQYIAGSPTYLPM